MTVVVNTAPLVDALERSAGKVDVATAAAVRAGSEVLAKYIRDELGKASHGRREKTGSQPGSPPEKITGTLQRSVKAYVPVRLGMGRYLGTAGPDELYGRFLQDGTRKMQAHPYIEQAQHEAEASGAVHEAVTKVWQTALGL